MRKIKEIDSLKKYESYQILFNPANKEQKGKHSDYRRLFANYCRARQHSAENLAFSKKSVPNDLLEFFKNYSNYAERYKAKKRTLIQLEPSKYTAPPAKGTLKTSPVYKFPTNNAIQGVPFHAYMTLEMEGLGAAARTARYNYKWFQIPAEKVDGTLKKKNTKEKRSGEKILKQDIIQKGAIHGERMNEKVEQNQYNQIHLDHEKEINRADGEGRIFTGWSDINFWFNLTRDSIRSYFSINGPAATQKVVLERPGDHYLMCIAESQAGEKDIVKRPPSVAVLKIRSESAELASKKGLKNQEKKDRNALFTGKTIVNAIDGMLKKVEDPIDENSFYGKASKTRDDIKNQVGLLEAHKRSNFDRLLVLKSQVISKMKKEKKNSHKWEQLNKFLKGLSKRIATQKERQKETKNGKANRVIASFSSTETGETKPLMLDAYWQGVDNSKKSETQLKYLVSDMTSKKGGMQAGVGKTKMEAIEKALLSLLSGPQGYGRGSLTFKVGSKSKTIQIHKSQGKMFREAMDNISTLLSILSLGLTGVVGKASLYMLSASSLAGGVSAGLRLKDRMEGATLELDMEATMDFLSLVLAHFGAAQGLVGVKAFTATTPNRFRLQQVEKRLAVIGVVGDGLSIILMNSKLASDLSSLLNQPSGMRTIEALKLIRSHAASSGFRNMSKLCSKLLNDSKVQGPKSKSSIIYELDQPKKKSQDSIKKGDKDKKTTAKSAITPFANRQSVGANINSNSPEVLFSKFRSRKFAKRETQFVEKSKKYTNNSVIRNNIISPDTAYEVYQEALRHSNGREVGIYYNGSYYAVVMGSQGSVFLPGWKCVLHFHHNQNASHKFKLPSPSDFRDMNESFNERPKKQVEFVESELKGLGKIRTEYGIDPSFRSQPYYISVIYPDGKIVTKRFVNLAQYKAVWNKAKSSVVKGSGQYLALIESLNRKYDKTTDSKQSGRREMAGTDDGEKKTNRYNEGFRSEDPNSYKDGHIPNYDHSAKHYTGVQGDFIPHDVRYPAVRQLENGKLEVRVIWDGQTQQTWECDNVAQLNEYMEQTILPNLHRLQDQGHFE